MEEAFPFRRKFHVIFCRNVMIYFDEQTRAALIDKYWSSLEMGGYLILGLTEAINKSRQGFRQVRPSVYRKDLM
jgi:chemotaxis protein methyltransferase CheR